MKPGLLGVVGAALFVVSAGVTVYVQNQKAKSDDEKQSSRAGASAANSAPPKPQSRVPDEDLEPKPNPIADSATELLAQLRQEQGVDRNTRKRQRHDLETIVDDLQTQRESLAALQVAIQKQLQQMRIQEEAVTESAATPVEEAASDDNTATPDAAPELPPTEAEADDSPPLTSAKNLRQMSEVFDKMSAESAAAVFAELVKNEGSETVVWMLSLMNARQAAKVLDVMQETDEQMAADLFVEWRASKLIPKANTTQ